MARFIEVTHLFGQKFLINVEHITEVAPTRDNKCKLLLTYDVYTVLESYDIVKEMLEEIS